MNDVQLVTEADLRPIHHYADGVYTRELFRPEKTLIIGKPHKHSTSTVLASGALAIWDGTEFAVFEAPAVFVSDPGVMKITYAITDATLVTSHPWDGPEDPDMIEAAMTDPLPDGVQQQVFESLNLRMIA